jgi:transcriptional regulator with XRE-family HTH domain
MNQEKIGKFIAENRKIKKITQSELAEKLGVTDRAVSNWENGKNMPDPDTIVRLCEVLSADPGHLLMNAQEQSIATCNITDMSLSDRALKVARAYEQMSDYGKALIDAVITQESAYKVVRRMPVMEGAHDSDVYVRYHSRKEVEEIGDDEPYNTPGTSYSTSMVIE